MLLLLLPSLFIHLFGMSGWALLLLPQSIGLTLVAVCKYVWGVATEGLRRCRRVHHTNPNHQS